MNAATSAQRRQRGPVLITGGCGFIGCNLADALAARGERVLVFDAMLRQGAESNARWLRQRWGDQVDIRVADIRDADAVNSAAGAASAVLHLAAQVAVTTSVQDPREDFEINAGGALNVLEAVRLYNPTSPVIFASTNKVYGRLLDDGVIVKRGKRYTPAEPRLGGGIGENTRLDFYSPYGCSKGTADQYVHDYARVYGLNTAVMRMSCIYGPRQFGTEDQGWVAHFLLRAIRGEPITIFGDGFQVRDLLHVSDAVAAWLGVLDRMHDVRGRVFNLGGGAANAVSLLELLDLIAELRSERPSVSFEAWRPGDQPWYVSDTGALAKAIGWRPRTTVTEGLHTLESWLESAFGARSQPKRKTPHATATEEMRL